MKHPNARVCLKTPRLPQSSVHSDSVQFPNTKRSGQTKSLITNRKKKIRDLDRVDDSTPFLQSFPWSRLCKMILGWLLHNFSSEEVGNFRCRPLCPHKDQKGTALNFKVSTIKQKEQQKCHWLDLCSWYGRVVLPLHCKGGQHPQKLLPFSQGSWSLRAGRPHCKTSCSLSSWSRHKHLREGNWENVGRIFIIGLYLIEEWVQNAGVLHLDRWRWSDGTRGSGVLLCLRRRIFPEKDFLLIGFWVSSFFPAADPKFQLPSRFQGTTRGRVLEL